MRSGTGGSCIITGDFDSLLPDKTVISGHRGTVTPPLLQGSLSGCATGERSTCWPTLERQQKKVISCVLQLANLQLANEKKEEKPAFRKRTWSSLYKQQETERMFL